MLLGHLRALEKLYCLYRLYSVVKVQAAMAEGPTKQGPRVLVFRLFPGQVPSVGGVWLRGARPRTTLEVVPVYMYYLLLYCTPETRPP